MLPFELIYTAIMETWMLMHTYTRTRKTNSNNINSKSGTLQKHHFTHTQTNTLIKLSGFHTQRPKRTQASFCGEPRSSESILFQFCNLDRTKTTFCLVCFCHSSASLISKQAKVAGEDKDIRARQTRSQITAS